MPRRTDISKILILGPGPSESFERARLPGVPHETRELMPALAEGWDFVTIMEEFRG